MTGDPFRTSCSLLQSWSADVYSNAQLHACTCAHVYLHARTHAYMYTNMLTRIRVCRHAHSQNTETLTQTQIGAYIYKPIAFFVVHVYLYTHMFWHVALSMYACVFDQLLVASNALRKHSASVNHSWGAGFALCQPESHEDQLDRRRVADAGALVPLEPPVPVEVSYASLWCYPHAHAILG